MGQLHSHSRVDAIGQSDGNDDQRGLGKVYSHRRYPRPSDLRTASDGAGFLSVAVLYWGTSRWFRHDQDPLERLVEETRPVWQRLSLRIARALGSSYAVTFVIWLCLVPLVAYRYQVVSLAGLVIGPPLVLL